MIVAALLSCVLQFSAEDLLREKLKAPYLSRASWVRDYDQAIEESARSGKPIFAYFTRSFAPCPPCDVLESGVLSTPEFAKLSEKYVLFCHITSHAQGEKRQELLAEKGGQAWPTLLFMDSDGKVLGLHKGALTVEGFEASGAKAKAFIELRLRAEKGGADAKIELALARLELRHIQPGEAEAKIREAGGAPTPEQARRLDTLTANIEVEAAAKTIKTEAASKAVAKKFYERRKAGKAAPTEEPWQGAYWNLVLNHAEAVKDVAIFREALGVLKEKYSGVPDVLKYIQAKEEVLKGLEK